MLYRTEKILVFVEGRNFKISMPKKLRPAGDLLAFKCRMLKVKIKITIIIRKKWVPKLKFLTNFKYLGCDIWKEEPIKFKQV